MSRVTRTRRPVSAEDLDATVAGAVAALRDGLDRDWDARAGGVRWSCQRTARHIADNLIAYAGQLVVCARDGYLPFRLNLDRGTPPGGALDVVEAMGALLAGVVRSAPDDAHGYHGYGIADAEGFAAIGAAEVLLHTHDIATGLGLRYQPDPVLCGRVTARLHPGLEPYDDPWRLLLWATGRADVPGRDHVRTWRWRASSPTDE